MIVIYYSGISLRQVNNTILMVERRPVIVATTPPGFSHSEETYFPRHERHPSGLVLNQKGSCALKA
jgi:hypothetical protein